MVSRVRRTLGVRQVGHAGTLDPIARGVLVMGVGPATRLLSYPSDQPKEYVAGLLLGRSTDSQDITGQTLSELGAETTTKARLEETASHFVGQIWQIPPMVSALKHKGHRLYDLARQGISVERAPRQVHVYSIQVEAFEPGVSARAILRVVCSSGFYVRTLCADIGARLGCGGCMESLCRTAVGPFRIADALTMDELAEGGAALLQPVTTAVGHLPGLVVTEDEAAGLRNGRYVERSSISGPLDGVPAGIRSWQEGAEVRLEDSSGVLLAMARTLIWGEQVRLQPFIVLVNGK